jgi:hypothetical protein
MKNWLIPDPKTTSNKKSTLLSFTHKHFTNNFLSKLQKYVFSENVRYSFVPPPTTETPEIHQSSKYFLTYFLFESFSACRWTPYILCPNIIILQSRNEIQWLLPWTKLYLFMMIIWVKTVRCAYHHHFILGHFETKSNTSYRSAGSVGRAHTFQKYVVFRYQNVRVRTPFCSLFILFMFTCLYYYLINYCDWILFYNTLKHIAICLILNSVFLKQSYKKCMIMMYTTKLN